MKLSAALAFALFVCSANGSRRRVQVFRCALRPTTGFNNICGEPVFQYDPQDPRLPPNPNFLFSAMRNETGNVPIPLTPGICRRNGRKLLATWANSDFYGANGWPLPDDRLLNIPYNRHPVGTGPDFVFAQTLDSNDPAATFPIPPTRSVPNPEDTIRSFTSVRGRSIVRCLPGGTAKVVLLGQGYAPNSVLTLWQVWQTNPSQGLPPIIPQPFGGIPNAVVADDRGSFVFKRDLSYCPMETQNGNIPLSISVAKHLDGNVYGGAPDIPLANLTFVDPTNPSGPLINTQGVGPGMMTVDQGIYPLMISPYSCS